jgi:hypothetical protein
MNILRRSFIEAILEDAGVKELNVGYEELKHIVFLVFIFGGDYQPTDRDNKIIESKMMKDCPGNFYLDDAVIFRGYFTLQ